MSSDVSLLTTEQFQSKNGPNLKWKSIFTQMGAKAKPKKNPEKKMQLTDR